MTEVFLTAPAQRKMQARGVEFREVEFAAKHPYITWTNRSLSGQLFTIHQRGDIGVVVDIKPDGIYVISVLWRHQEQWTDGEMFITRMIYDEGRKTEKPKGRR